MARIMGILKDEALSLTLRSSRMAATAFLEPSNLLEALLESLLGTLTEMVELLISSTTTRTALIPNEDLAQTRLETPGAVSTKSMR